MIRGFFSLEAPPERTTGSVALAFGTWLLLVVGSGIVLLNWGKVPMSIGVVLGFLALGVAVMGCGRVMGDYDRMLALESLLGWFLLLLINLAVLLGAFLAVPPAYHAIFGERAAAVVTEKTPAEQCRVAPAETSQDLGWMWGVSTTCGDIGQGDPIEVSTDPHGWVAPVPTDDVMATRTGQIVLLAWLLPAPGIVAAAIAVTAVRIRRERRWMTVRDHPPEAA